MLLARSLYAAMESTVTEHVLEVVGATRRKGWAGALAVAAPALCGVILVALAIHSVTVPIGEHNDSRTILDTVQPILSGHYQRSRSFGVPLYEVITALLVGLGGTLLANLYSLALAIGSVFLFDGLLGRGLAPMRRILALAAFAFNPIFLSNSTMIIEWMQVVFFLLCLLVAANAVRHGRGARSIVAFALVSIACVLTRPDLSLFCLAVFLTIVWDTRDFRLGARLLGACALAGLVTIVIFLSLNTINELSDAITVEDRELSRRVILATVDAVALLGIVGSLAALVLLIGIGREILLRGASALPFETKLLLLILPIVAVRQVGLPSKVEFLFPLLIVFLLAVARNARSVRVFALLSASLVLGSVVQLSLLARGETGDALHIRLQLNPGAVAQDFDRRVQNTAMFEPAYLAALASVVYGDAGSIPKLEPRTFFPGLISDTNDLVIGEPAAYQLDNPRFAFGGTRRMFGGNGDSRRSAYRNIYICDKSVAAAGKGWRVLQAPTPIARLDPTTGKVDTQCAREAAQ